MPSASIEIKSNGIVVSIDYNVQVFEKRVSETMKETAMRALKLLVGYIIDEAEKLDKEAEEKTHENH